MVTTLIEITDMVVKRIHPSLTNIIRMEISALILKVILGVVISSTLIFSIFQLTVYYVTWLEPTKSGTFYPFLVFSSIILLCIITLYFMFKPSKKRTNPVATEEASSLFLVFALGFLSGFNSKRENHNNK